MQGPLPLKSIFLLNHQFLYWSLESPLEKPLWVPEVKTFRGSSEDVPGRSCTGWIN